MIGNTDYFGICSIDQKILFKRHGSIRVAVIFYRVAD